MAETKLSKAKQLAVLRQQQVGEVFSQEDFDKALKEADKKTTTRSSRRSGSKRSRH
jgi:hypothetical protein